MDEKTKDFYIQRLKHWLTLPDIEKMRICPFLKRPPHSWHKERILSCDLCIEYFPLGKTSEIPCPCMHYDIRTVIARVENIIEEES